MNSLGDGAYEISNFRGKLRRISDFGNLTDDGAADDDSICEACHGGGLFWVRDAESHSHRYLGEGTDGGNTFCDIGRKAGLLAGNSFTGDIVDESLGGIGDLLEALRRRRRGD